MIVVDDGSTDSTADIVQRYAEHHPQIRLAPHERNLGYGHALRTGLREAKGDAVFFTDADRQFRLADLERLISRFDGIRVVVGYRLRRNDPWHRLVVAWVYHRVLSLVFGLHLRDIDCAFKLVGRDVLETVGELRSRSAFISPELMIRAGLAGYEIVEVGIPHHPRTAGRPKGATPKVIARTLVEILRMWRTLRREA